MFIFQFICLCIIMTGILANSLGSESESLLTCSKFHFEEKVLEKVVRLENQMKIYAEKIKFWEESVSSKLDHKMDIYAEKVKLWEDSVSTSLDKMTESKKRTEKFVDSMQYAYLQDKTWFNNSFIELKKQTETFVDTIRDEHLHNQTRFNDFFHEAKKQTETFVDSIRDEHQQDQTRFNDFFHEAKNQTETFLDSMRDEHLQDQTRFNDAFLEVVGRFKLQSENETEFYEGQMNSLLNSFSSKVQKLSETERKRESTMKLSLYQEQHRFNESFKSVETFKVRLKNFLQEIASKQQKVALTACHQRSVVSEKTIVRFSVIKTSIGIPNLSSYKSTGKFICTVAGLYQILAVMASYTQNQYYSIYKNNHVVRNTFYGKTDRYSQTAISVFVTMLDVRDEITVRTGGYQYLYNYSCFTIVKLN